jgi:hypothetical protein
MLLQIKGGGGQASTREIIFSAKDSADSRINAGTQLQDINFNNKIYLQISTRTTRRHMHRQHNDFNQNKHNKSYSG